MHTDMDFDLDEVLKTLPGGDEGPAPVDGKLLCSPPPFFYPHALLPCNFNGF